MKSWQTGLRFSTADEFKGKLVQQAMSTAKGVNYIHIDARIK